MQGGYRCNQGATYEKRCPRRVVPRAVGCLPQSAVTLLRRPRSRDHCRVRCRRHNPASRLAPYCDPGSRLRSVGPPTGAAVTPSVTPPYARGNRYRNGRRGAARRFGRRAFKPSGGAGSSRSWDWMLAGVAGGCRGCNQGANLRKKGAHGAGTARRRLAPAVRGHAASASQFEGSPQCLGVRR